MPRIGCTRWLPRPELGTELGGGMKRLTVVALVVVLGLSACRDETTAPSGESSPQLSQGSSRSISGWLHTEWGDPRGGRGSALVRHELIDDRGRATELLLDEGLLARLGGSLALSRKRVRIDGQEMASGRIQVRSLELERAAGPAGAASAAAAAVPRLGSHPYVTIGCKFSDIAAEPHTIATYTTWTTGISYPGLNHYWAELSFNQMNLDGSIVAGWYTLPQPRSHYFTPIGLDLVGLVTDCTGVADPDVNFPQFYGINLQFNAVLDGFAYGGSWTLTADGQTSTYGVTWMPDNADVDIYAHEEGHSLGLPHSSGPYGQTYDSRWDVMSGGRFYDPAQGTNIPQHTISYHKDLLGWIPAARKLTVGANTTQTITLERLAQPGSGNYLMATIPIANAPGQFYTVEARRKVGSYDINIPGDAVVLHRVDGRAVVVDVDNNGDPNDAGAQWTVGETFTDLANGITVAVNAQTTTGFEVTIKSSANNIWASQASLTKARSAFALTLGGNLIYAIGGKSNGTILASVEAYNPTSNTWTGKAALPSARYDGNGATANGGVFYLPGGRNSAGTLTKTLYVYTRLTNVWSTKAALPISSGCGASVIISGLLYVMTGCDGTSGYKGRLHRYTPATNTWTVRATAPAAHGNPAVGVISGKLYVAGGRNAAGAATATLHVYDPATNTWSTKFAMPSARYGASGRVLNGKLYVVGGTNASGGILAETLVYDPAINRWSTKTSMPTARTRLESAVINNLLYAVGGRVTTDLTKVERYAP
jgi:M6 family metalloprotease-like protein